MIYLDNAATSFHKPNAVIEAVASAMRHMGNSGRGAHGASLDASRMIYDTRKMLAELFHAGDPSRVAFTANSTESLNIAIQGAFAPGDHVITTMMEHNSVLRPLYLMRERGVELTILKADRLGNVRYEDFEAAVRENTKGVVCTHASNLTGNPVDVARIGRLCREKGLLFIVDASQSAGVFDIDMERMGIDILCFTGHKSLMGPQGTGGICVREGVNLRPLLVGGSGVHSYSKTHPAEMPTALEAGTLNGHGIAGLHAALGYIREKGVSQIRDREMELMKRFYDGARQIPGVTVYGDFSCLEHWQEKEAAQGETPGAGTAGMRDMGEETLLKAASLDRACEENRNDEGGVHESEGRLKGGSAMSYRAPIVTINILDYDSGEVADELASRYDIYTRAGAHCAPLMHEALGTVDQGAVRFSISHFNTEEEIDQALQAVREIAEE